MKPNSNEYKQILNKLYLSLVHIELCGFKNPDVYNKYDCKLENIKNEILNSNDEETITKYNECLKIINKYI